MDFRGRIYPVQAYLNPQGDDVARGLLLFDKKKKLGEKGLVWLKVHGANTYGKNGLDKLPFDERIAWVDAHEEMIVKTAESFSESELFKEAEDPWQFLAFCYEYAGYLKDPENFESALPVGVDGSNNGLQHISALYKDKRSAQLVNVLANEEGKPEDIYREVAEYSQKKIRKELEVFEKKKHSYLQDKNGYVLVKKKNTKIMVENYLDSALIERFSKQIDIVKTKSNRHRRIGWIEEKLKDEFKQKYLYKGMAQLIYRLMEKGHFDPTRFEKLSHDHLESFKQGTYYTNNNGMYVQTQISPLNFFDEALLRCIDRDLVKANVMTDSYGAGIDTKRKQVLAKLKKLQKDNQIEKLDAQYLNDVASYIAKMNDKSLDSISQSSQHYMSWMKSTIEKIYENKENKDYPVEWTTPLGLKVAQLKFETKEHEITTAFGQARVYVQYRTNKKSIDKGKQRSGFAPNFIHSLDATHLYMTILEAKKRGVENFMTIHDSFGTHAADIDILLDALKSQFIAIHQNAVMETLKQELEEKFNVKLNEIEYIDKNFNIGEVEGSGYFFA
jgi:DNA-directed RNA polymerase